VFRQAVENLWSERRRFVINLTEVDHVDSTGLAALVHLFTPKRDPKSEARLVSSRTYLTDLLRRTRLDTVMTVYGSEEEAVASFEKRPQ
jgi:anti-anti-sigma factor